MLLQFSPEQGVWVSLSTPYGPPSRYRVSGYRRDLVAMLVSNVDMSGTLQSHGTYAPLLPEVGYAAGRDWYHRDMTGTSKIAYMRGSPSTPLASDSAGIKAA